MEVDPPDVALRALCGHGQRFALLTRATPGGLVFDLPGGFATVTGPAGPNGVFFTSPMPDHAAALAQARRMFHEHGIDTYVVAAREGYDDPAIRLLVASGARMLRREGCMALAPIVVPRVHVPDDLEIRRLHGESGLEEYLRVGALGFEEGPDEQRRYYPPAVAVHDAFALYAGYVRDEPVGTVAVITTDAGAGVYGLSVLPPHRRRGIGSALTTTVLRECRQDLAFLQPSSVSVRMYERLGFRTVGSYQLVIAGPED